MNYKVQAITSTVTMVETTACSINGLPNPIGRREKEVGEVKGAQERAEEEEDEG